MSQLRHEVVRWGAGLAFGTVAALGVVSMAETVSDPLSAQALGIMPTSFCTGRLYPGNATVTTSCTQISSEALHEQLVNTVEEAKLELEALVIGVAGLAATRTRHSVN